MIGQELIPLYPNRPAVIKRGPEYFYVSMRDQAFLSRMRTFRRLLIQDHPDRGGDLRRFLIVSKKRASFLKQERAWYEALGLGLPGESDPLRKPATVLHGAVRTKSKGLLPEQERLRREREYARLKRNIPSHRWRKHA